MRESPWVQKHRSFWEEKIHRLLAQCDDKEIAAILFCLWPFRPLTIELRIQTNRWLFTMRIHPRLLWRLQEHIMLIRLKDWKKNIKLGNILTQRFVLVALISSVPRRFFFNVLYVTLHWFRSVPTKLVYSLLILSSGFHRRSREDGQRRNRLANVELRWI